VTITFNKGSSLLYCGSSHWQTEECYCSDVGCKAAGSAEVFHEL